MAHGGVSWEGTNVGRILLMTLIDMTTEGLETEIETKIMRTLSSP
jgi:hypothetical protein